jgi:hypothetical protein
VLGTHNVLASVSTNATTKEVRQVIAECSAAGVPLHEQSQGGFRFLVGGVTNARGTVITQENACLLRQRIITAVEPGFEDIQAGRCPTPAGAAQESMVPQLCAGQSSR